MTRLFQVTLRSADLHVTSIVCTARIFGTLAELWNLSFSDRYTYIYLIPGTLRLSHLVGRVASGIPFQYALSRVCVVGGGWGGLGGNADLPRSKVFAHHPLRFHKG